MTRTTITTTLAAVTLAGVGASLANAHPSAMRSDRLSYEHVNAIVLDNTQGHVNITAGRTNNVSVERKTQTFLSNATNSAYIDDHHVLHLASTCHGTACEVDYDITTPANVRLRISEKNANVAIDGTPGNLAVANSGEGNITLDLTTAPQRVTAATHNGNIDISVPRGPYAVTAHAANGNKTITGITVNHHGRRVVASADHGDITINGR